MTEVLRLTSIGRAFNGTTVLQDVNLSLNAGERLAILGPSGSGKTTLLRLIAGLETLSSGEIAIDGKLVSRPGEILIAPEHRGVALVFQGLALFPQLRALDQIAFAARGRGGMKHAKALLDQIGLDHRATARLDELSGGERQRIALARALAQKPKLILMDEPFASLDDEKRAEMRDLLRSLLHNSQMTLILVTHSRDDALNLATEALVLERGRSMSRGLLETVLARPRNSAAVHSLGLGQIIEGEVDSTGRIQTVFGSVQSNFDVAAGRRKFLVRPGQPRIVSDDTGVKAEVISIELRPPELRQIRRVAIVRVGQTVLRVLILDRQINVGDHVHICIEGECESLDL